MKKDLRVVLTGVMIFISYQVYSNPESGTKEQGDVYRNLPFSMPEVSQPSFPDYEVNIRDFGALSDGVTLNTEVILLIYLQFLLNHQRSKTLFQEFPFLCRYIP